MCMSHAHEIPLPTLVPSDFSSKLLELVETHDDVVVLSADLGDSCGLAEVRTRYPERYINLGLTEQNICSWAAGLAREGLRPVVVTFGAFLYRRALDQIEMGIAASGLPVVLVGFVPGITTPRGISHQAINDVSVMRSVPGMTVVDCGEATEVSGALEAAYQLDGPAYVRMLRYLVPSFFPSGTPFEVGRVRELSQGDDLCIVSSSVLTAEALRATHALAERGIYARHLHVSTPAPLDVDAIAQAAKAVRSGVITIENQVVEGGLGSAVAEVMAECGCSAPLMRLGLLNTYARSGSIRHLMAMYGMDAMAIVRAAERLLGTELGIAEADLPKALL